MKQLLILNPENVTPEELTTYKVRHAARAVVVNADGKIAMLFVAKENYYKLPGGGLEENEDQVIALRRECQEEIGTDVEVISEVGIIEEYRKFDRLHQISFCYLAKPVGQPVATAYTLEEQESKFRAVWLSYEEAIQGIHEHVAHWIEGNEYAIPRDSTFLVEVKKLLHSKP